MKRILNPIKLARTGLFVAAISLTAAGTGALAEGADQQAAVDTYEWSAEMVAYDAAAGTMTVRARIEQYSPIESLESFEEGDRLTLVWTGRSWASGVRNIAVDPVLDEAVLRIPIEFVGTELDDRYVVFRVPVPAGSAARLEALEPGARITAASPRGDVDWDGSVVSVRHYNDVS